MDPYITFAASSGQGGGAGIADVIIEGLKSAAQSYQAFLNSQRGIYPYGTQYPQGMYPYGYNVPTSTSSLGGNSTMLLLLGAAAIIAVVLIAKH